MTDLQKQYKDFISAFQEKCKNLVKKVGEKENFTRQEMEEASTFSAAYAFTISQEDTIIDSIRVIAEYEQYLDTLDELKE